MNDQITLLCRTSGPPESALLQSPAFLTSKLLDLSAAIVQEYMVFEIFCTFKIELTKNYDIKTNSNFKIVVNQ